MSVTFTLLSKVPLQNTSVTKKSTIKSSKDEIKTPIPKKKNLIESIYENGKSLLKQLMYKPKAKAELEEIIYHGCNWCSTPFQIDCFNRGLSILAIAIDSDNSVHEIDEIHRQLMEHLKRSHFNVDIMILTFSAKVFFVLSEFVDRGKERLNLESSIAKCIEAINLDENYDRLTKILNEFSDIFLPLGKYAEWKLKDLERHPDQQIDVMIRKLTWIMFHLCGFNWVNLILRSMSL